MSIFPEIDQSQLIFQHASKGSAFNHIKLITNADGKDALLTELKKPDKELLELAFSNHTRVLRFNGDSGLCPHMIMSVHIYIDRISPTIEDLEPSEDYLQDLSENESEYDL